MQQIDILMATYNSEKYLENQIDSILNQTYSNYHINICDDASTDNTINILSNYKMQQNNKISYTINNKNIGIKKNFSILLNNSTAEYIMFSDHDDVWVNNKIEKSYNKIIEMENIYSKNTPILVFCDKYVTDENLNIISNSHNKLEKFNTNAVSFNRLLMANIISGCTIIINKALKNLCANIPEDACMHDYWISLNAAAFGKIGYISEPLMYYRQHSNNQLGAKNYSLVYAFDKFNKGKKSLQESIMKNITQAESFYNKYNTQLNTKDIEIITNFISLRNKRNFMFIYTVMKYKFYKHGLLKNLGLFFAFM